MCTARNATTITTLRRKPTGVKRLNSDATIRVFVAVAANTKNVMARVAKFRGREPGMNIHPGLNIYSPGQRNCFRGQAIAATPGGKTCF